MELGLASELLKHITKKFNLKHELLHQTLENGIYMNNSVTEISLLNETKYLSNHPPHIYNKDKTNPSSFIPFCKFGGNFSLIDTISSNHFPIPTCNAFKPMLLEGQVYFKVEHTSIEISYCSCKVCYSLTTPKVEESHSAFSSANKAGLELILDYNEDRTSHIKMENNHALIHIETIGKIYF